MSGQGWKTPSNRGIPWEALQLRAGAGGGGWGEAPLLAQDGGQGPASTLLVRWARHRLGVRLLVAV